MSTTPEVSQILLRLPKKLRDKAYAKLGRKAVSEHLRRILAESLGLDPADYRLPMGRPRKNPPHGEKV